MGKGIVFSKQSANVLKFYRLNSKSLFLTQDNKIQTTSRKTVFFFPPNVN